MLALNCKEAMIVSYSFVLSYSSEWILIFIWCEDSEHTVEGFVISFHCQIFCVCRCSRRLCVYTHFLSFLLLTSHMSCHVLQGCEWQSFALWVLATHSGYELLQMLNFQNSVSLWFCWLQFCSLIHFAFSIVYLSSLS